MRTGVLPSPHAARPKTPLRAMLTNVEQDSYVGRSGVTLADYVHDWLSTVRPRLRATTSSGQSVAVRPIASQLGATRLQALTPL